MTVSKNTKVLSLDGIKFGATEPFVLISGPCQLESLDHALFLADKISGACHRAGISFVFKSSYDKANRSSISTQRGVGLDEGLSILEKVKERFGCPVLTDVHEADQCDLVSEVVDVLQIPAFLCRQTDLLLAAGRTGRFINVKKGQFLAPWDMPNIVEKIESVGNNNILLCDRGTSFGYNTLVSDFRSLPIMAQTGYPVVFDATHSVQQPGSLGGRSGGQREFVPVLAAAACAVGVSAIFLETHENPDCAPSDGPNMVDVAELQGLLVHLKKIDEISKNQRSI